METAHGPAFVRDRWFALEHRHGNLPLAAALELDPGALSCLLSGPSAQGDGREHGAGGRRAEGGGCEPTGEPRSSLRRQAAGVCAVAETAAAPEPDLRPPACGSRRRLGFFDIETTGLGGGTGTYVFLAGLGTFEDDGFRLRQYFLADVAGERAMLALLADDLSRCDALVTYNGRAFDVPIVETRLTLSRLRSPCASLAHFDLLQPMRRLYRHRLPSCRLVDAERRLLGIERFDDTPGSLMPAIYFAYVRAGQTAPLRGVFQHNADDVLSLVGLLARLTALFSSTEPPPDDAAALARWWEREGAPERARALYRRALPWLEGGDDWTWAAHRQARLSRRAGDHDEAAALWRALWARGDAAAGLALAKHLEHRAREYAGAAEITRALLAGGAHDAGGLRSRLARIERKIVREPTIYGAGQNRRTA
ncbi:MAG: ribonuclease H-like domain-containing protein [Dehalococcoidia bacterium]|nr:ribonuclease H-like domain-containing protein [Dehalococcoidia bacterium]